MGDVLKQISIKNFKGYTNQQDIVVAIPNGTTGSGLTFMVGENNSGKSTVFDSVKKLSSNSKFLPKERNQSGDPEIIFTDKNGVTTTLKRGNKATVSITTGPGGLIEQSLFELVPSRRHWNHSFNSANTQNYQGYLTNTFQQNNKYSVDESLGGLLEKISDTAALKADFDSMMKLLIPGFSKWEIDSDDNSQDYVKYFITGGISHDTSLVGDGVVSLFRICAHLASTNNDLITYIDEPELSLSPITQKRVANLLSKKSALKQILVNTHCPHLIRWQDIDNGAKVYRTRKRTDGYCEVRKLDATSTHFRKIIASQDDWQKPHVLDAVAKEIFFTENVLFLEGQEDVGLIRKFSNDNGIDLNFEIFGYGAGGSGNIPSYFSLCKDLGIKAAAIFDKAAPGLTAAQGMTEFKVIEHIYDDIRYKASKPTKTGFFDENGTITATKTTELKTILQDLVTFFN